MVIFFVPGRPHWACVVELHPSQIGTGCLPVKCLTLDAPPSDWRVLRGQREREVELGILARRAPKSKTPQICGVSVSDAARSTGNNGGAIALCSRLPRHDVRGINVCRSSSCPAPAAVLATVASILFAICPVVAETRIDPRNQARGGPKWGPDGTYRFVACT